MEESAGLDFFISYTGVDVAWARWIAVELERAGYRTFVQVLDIRPGQDFVHEMQQAATRAARTIAVLSPTYGGSQFGEAEWRVAFAGDPSGADRRLIPVRIAAGRVAGLLATRAYVDLVGCDEDTARARLLTGVGPAGARPATAIYPGSPPTENVARVSYPGREPMVSNLPARNHTFVGRASSLEQLHERLRQATVAAVLPVEAVHGLGGVGKTELVLEFAHRYRSDYDLVWWIPAEEPTSAATALAELALRLGVPAAPDQQAVIGALFELLRQRGRWLLIYDNAEQPDTLQGLLPPAGAGSVVVTSRWSAWRRHAQPLPLTVLERRESVQLLIERAGLPNTEHPNQADQLDQLAELVGDLPLALTEAAAYLEQTRIGIGDYLQLLRARARELFGLDPTDTPEAAEAAEAAADQRRVATVWSVSLDRIRNEVPAAEGLLELCAFLGPDIPRALLSTHLGVLPDQLAEVVTDALAYNRLLAGAARYSLIDLDPDSIGMHRLVQAVVRARLAPEQESEAAATAVGLIWVAFPRDSWEVATWPECARLLPHLLTVCEHAQRLDVSAERTGRLLNRASTYLQRQGQYQQALPLAQRCIAVTEAALGPDHLHAAWGRGQLGVVRHALGELPAARTQLEHALRIGEAALGPDHPYVSDWHNDLGCLLLDLCELPGARTHLEQALRIGEATLGPDHPDVGAWHNNLGRVLHALGELPAARTQYELALRISEAALGPAHPDVAAWGNNLGRVLHDLGELPAARTELERALRIGEAALGPEHPDVGAWHNDLGRLLHDLGDLPAARTELGHALRISEAALGPDHQRSRTISKALEQLETDTTSPHWPSAGLR